MKPRNFIFQRLPAALLPVAMAGSLSLIAAPQVQPAKQEAPQSVFIIPNNPNEGRDPFFPESTRHHAESSKTDVANTPAPVATGSLTLKSIVGGLAIINNHSFAPGEEGDVLISNGQRQHIRLMEIKPKTQSVVVEVGSQSIELKLQDGI